MWLCGHMKILGSDPRLDRALEDWARVAPSLGFDPSGFKSRVIWEKDDAQRSHIVVRLKGSRTLILKRVFKAPQDASLPEAVAAQQAAFTALAERAKAHAPEVLFASEDGTFVLMAEASGKTLNDHLNAGRPHAQMLRRTGKWLAAFHGSNPTETRTYQPKYMVGHVQRMADGIADGSLNVAQPDLFAACCARVPQIAEGMTDQQTVSATKHGDFNLRNILLGPDGATGLDFKPVSTAPVGFDIARLLMDYAELFQAAADVPAGALLSDATLDAFFEGYDLVGRDDPSVRFVPYVQILNDWRLIPPDPAKRSWRQAARMDRIASLARTAFALN